MKIVKPTFYRILVKVDKTKEQEKREQSTIHLLDDYKEDKYATAAQTTGVVVAIGDGCFDGKFCSGPQYKVGDRVVFQSHRGIRVFKKEDEKKQSLYRLLNEDDVWAVVELEESDYEDLADECRN